jgi:predicted DNA-binding transcriptional regulator AlpA
MLADDGSKLVSQRQAAEMLGLSARTLESMRLKCIGPSFVRLSRRCVRYQVVDIQAWIEQHRVKTENEIS